MTKRRLASYGLNLVGVALLYAAITLAFTFNAFGKSTTYIQGICTTACYTIIMVTSLNLVVGFMGEFSMGHAGFVSVGAYVSAIVSGALAGKISLSYWNQTGSFSPPRTWKCRCFTVWPASSPTLEMMR